MCLHGSILRSAHTNMTHTKDEMNPKDETAGGGEKKPPPPPPLDRTTFLDTDLPPKQDLVFILVERRWPSRSYCFPRKGWIRSGSRMTFWTRCSPLVCLSVCLCGLQCTISRPKGSKALSFRLDRRFRAYPAFFRLLRRPCANCFSSALLNECVVGWWWRWLVTTVCVKKVLFVDKSGQQRRPISCCMTIVGLDDEVEHSKG